MLSIAILAVICALGVCFIALAIADELGEAEKPKYWTYNR